MATRRDPLGSDHDGRPEKSHPRTPRNGWARGLPVPPDPQLWELPDVRAALAARDVAALFRILQQQAISQRRIAALTGQSQSEISEILGGRQVSSYDVLLRIADGLGIPRGHMGLASSDETVGHGSWRFELQSPANGESAAEIAEVSFDIKLRLVGTTHQAPPHVLNLLNAVLASHADDEQPVTSPADEPLAEG